MTAPTTRTAVFSAVWKVDRILSSALASPSASLVTVSIALSATALTPLPARVGGLLL
jgi:hypothetical protein